MTPPDSPGDVRMLQRPSEPETGYGDYAEYGGYAPPDQTMAMPASPTEQHVYRRPVPVVSLLDPKVAIGLVVVAMLIGFALATLLFGVVLRPDGSESIAGVGTEETPPVDESTESLPLQGQDPNPVDPFNADGEAFVGPADDEAMEEAMTDSTVVASVPPSSPTTLVPPTTTPTVPTTVATTVPTTAATTPTTASTTAPPNTSADTTAPPTSAAPAPGPSGGDAAIQQQILDLTNAERAKAGCNAVILDPTLNAVADGHSEDMAANNYFDHTGLDGSQPWDRVSAAGYPARGSGENIAQGYSSPADVVAGWMNSPGHRRNMLDCGWTELGVGYAEGNGAGGNIRPLYWTQVFAIRR